MSIRRKMRNRLLVATVTAGALGLTALGATAFTNSTTFSNSNTHVGYGSETVSGAVVTSIQYGLSADGQTINSVTFVATGDTHGSAGAVGFSTISSTDTPQPTTPCNAGTYSAGTGNTTYVCDDDGPGIGQAVDDVEATNIVVD
jgi:hypothetical protein